MASLPFPEESGFYTSIPEVIGAPLKNGRDAWRRPIDTVSARHIRCDTTRWPPGSIGANDPAGADGPIGVADPTGANERRSDDPLVAEARSGPDAAVKIDISCDKEFWFEIQRPSKDPYVVKVGPGRSQLTVP